MILCLHFFTPLKVLINVQYLILRHEMKTNHWLFKLPILRNYAAITLPWGVYYKDENPSDSLITHEMTHVKQIRIHGVFCFYTSYLLYFLAGMVRYFDWDRAYWEIPFEVEAREAERSSLVSTLEKQSPLP